MTRRKFIEKLLKTGSALVGGFCWVSRKALPRRFVRAVRTKGYPGHVGTLQDIDKQAKWSG